MKPIGLISLSIGFSAASCCGQRTLAAHDLPPNVTSIPNAAIFFDVQALRDPIVVEAVTTAMYAGAHETFRVEVLVRDGTSLGGTATTGPGSSLEGWTSLGVVQGIVGSVGGGLSEPIQMPRFVVRPGHLTGVALAFNYEASASCWGGPAYAVYQDDAVRLTTGDLRTSDFTPFQFYSPRTQLIGSITYDLDPCYANCDGSTTDPVLNVNDFICFLSSFARADSYANCDHSTTPPILNVNDFLCFTQQFAAGCS